jgi:hypothetical protein
VSASLKAFNLLTKSNEAIVDALFGDDSLSIIFHEVVQPAEDRWYLNRFAPIAQSSILNRPDQVQRRCPFLPDLFAYAGERSIFDLFDVILTQDKEDSGRAIALQENLDARAFLMQFFVKLQEVGQDHENESSPTERWQKKITLTALFKLVPNILGVAAFQSVIATLYPIDLLMFAWTEPSIPLQNAQWAAISSFLTRENIVRLLQEAQRFEFVVSVIDDLSFGFQAYHESGLKILAIAAEASAVFRGQLLDIGFPDKLAAIVAGSPTHTICHGAVTKFLEQVLNLQELQAIFIEAFMQLIADVFSQPGFPQLKGFAWKVLKMFKRYQPGILERMPQASRERYLALDQTTVRGYGGKVPKVMDEVAQAQFVLSGLAMKR